MPIYLAHKTLAAIELAISSDQGATYRQNLEKVIPHIGDAYRGEDDGFRGHLGASLIGRECARELWYSFRWSSKASFSGQMLRLFNRGHLEEARFIAILLTIGCQIYQQDSEGKQFRISEFGGHFGGSGDGVAVGIPDLPAGTPSLTEFKTHNDKSFQKLKSEGVQKAKPEHYVQMQIYMKKMGLSYALYAAVNKNDDELHLEIIVIDPSVADQFIDRAAKIIFFKKAPDKINKSPGFFKCRFCDAKAICHFGKEPARNCRTCEFSQAAEDGKWYCTEGQEPAELTKEKQLAGCTMWARYKD